MVRRVGVVGARSGARILAFALGLFLIAASPLLATRAYAADFEDEVARVRDFANTQRCEEASADLQRLHAQAPDDARLLVLMGQCEIQRHRYAEAVQLLDAAAQLDFDQPHLPLYQGIARYHLGEFDAAREALARVRAQNLARAELQLYSGLLLLQSAESRDAALRLEQARRVDPDAVEPVASYYSGLAWAAIAERERAAQAFERVIREAPDTRWSRAAERALERTRLTPWYELSAGYEYDDNVVLRGGGLPLAGEIASQGDTRFSWSAVVGRELLRNEGWSLGAAASYLGTSHDTLHAFSVQVPRASVWLDRRLGKHGTARVQYDMDYSFVGGDPFRIHQRVTPSYYHRWLGGSTSRVFVSGERSNYFVSSNDVPTTARDESSARNRDSWSLRGGFEHEGELEGGLRYTAGYAAEYLSARGSEYSFVGHGVRAGMRAPIGWGFEIDLGGGYTYRSYRHGSTFGISDSGVRDVVRGGDRTDNSWRMDAAIVYPVRSWLELSARYGHWNNRSNVEAFDYRRETVGMFITVRSSASHVQTGSGLR